MSDPFLAAARCEPAPDRVPIWFMRQAGRSLPEYKEVRGGTTMLEACRTPDLVCEITLQPVRRHGVDAAVFYSDIMVPVWAAGVGVDIVPGTGPVVADPIRTAEQVEALPDLTLEDLGFITDAVRLLVAELDVPLLGFCGAPFTLASYLVEGGPSKTHAVAKSFMVSQPDVWSALCAKLTDYSVAFLRAQIDAGAAAVQIFDSWAGSLAPTTTGNRSCPIRGVCSPESPMFLGSISASEPASCCRIWPVPDVRSSASTIASPSQKRRVGSGNPSQCRAISTAPC